MGEPEPGAANWRLIKVPDGWSELGELGLRRAPVDGFVENLVVQQDTIAADMKLAAYVDHQLAHMRPIVAELVSQTLGAGRVFACDEALTVRLTFTYNDKPIVQFQHYLRRDETIGVVTWSKPPPATQPDAMAFRNLLGCFEFV